MRTDCKHSRITGKPEGTELLLVCRRLAENLAFCLRRPGFGPITADFNTALHIAGVSGYPVHRGTPTETLPRVFPRASCCNFLVLLRCFFHMREKLEQRVIECLWVFELHSVGGSGYLDFSAGRDTSV